MPLIIFAGCKKESSSEKISADVSADATTSAAISVEENTIASALAAREGFGSTTPGGKGKPVFHVTNLNPPAQALLHAAMGSNRTIVFDVGGTINNFNWDSSIESLLAFNH